jgi:hypothetical protein
MPCMDDMVSLSSGVGQDAGANEGRESLQRSSDLQFPGEDPRAHGPAGCIIVDNKMQMGPLLCIWTSPPIMTRETWFTRCLVCLFLSDRLCVPSASQTWSTVKEETSACSEQAKTNQCTSIRHSH